MKAKTCRLCLNEDGEFYGLFDLADTDSLRIVDEINHLLNIRIYEEDRLPNSICSNCYKILDFFKEFRLTCLKVNNFLLEQVMIWRHLDEESFLEVIKSGRKCTTTCLTDIRASRLTTENAEEPKLSIGKDNKSLNTSFLDFVCDSRRENHLTRISSNIHSSDNQSNEFSDMPPLIRIDDLITTKSNIKKQHPEGKNSAFENSKNSPILPEIIEESVEKSLPEASVFEGYVLWNNKRYDSEDNGAKTDLELEGLIHTVQQNNSPLISPEVREHNSRGSIDKPFDCYNSTSLDEYLPKSEEVILSESEYETETPKDDSENICGSLLQEQDESNAEVISIRSSGSSEKNDLVIELPDKIHKYETDFNKAILDALLCIQNNGVKLSNSIVKETAKKIAADRRNEKFTASNGWMISFYKRFNIDPYSDKVTITTDNLQARTLSNRFIIRYCCDEVNEYTFNTCEGILNSGAELSAKLIQTIASNIAHDEGLSEFIATIGWLNSFRRKYVVNLRGRKIPLLELCLRL